MFGQTLAIAWNTFSESIRQPVVLVMIVVATLLIVLSNPFAAFTMEDDQRMFIDIALSTVFIATIILSAFLATNVLNREIENKTVLTVVSKPVNRIVFVLGKYLGVAGALLLTILCLAFVFMLVERHGTLPTVASPYHKPVLAFGLGGLAAGLGVAVWTNYFYGRSFPSAVLLATTPLLGVAYLLSLFFKHDFSPTPIAASFRLDLWLAVLAMSLAVMVLTAVAVAASTRLGQVLTLSITLGMFMAGMLSDWLFGRTIARLSDLFQRTQASAATFDADHMLLWFCKMCYAIVPNFQVFWLSDALTQRRAIPLSYIAEIVPYGLVYVVVALAAAVALFERREVG